MHACMHMCVGVGVYMCVFVCLNFSLLRLHMESEDTAGNLAALLMDMSDDGKGTLL